MDGCRSLQILGPMCGGVYLVLAYSYSEQHLNLKADTSSHSCMFAVNARATDADPSSFNFKRCANCMISFNHTLELRDHNDIPVDTSRRLDGTTHKETNSMRKIVPGRGAVHGTSAARKSPVCGNQEDLLGTWNSKGTAAHRPEAKSLARGI